MTVFSATEFNRHEEVHFFHDPDLDLKVIIALHNLSRGPALGGCRYWTYDNDDEAISDALRLSRGMTYKAALANVNFGGGKAVIIGDPKTEKTPERLRAYAKFVDSLGGKYVTAEDVGTNVNDMELIHHLTPHVVGLQSTPAASGDPSPATAYGVFMGIRASLQHVNQTNDLSNVHVAVQGLGNVGCHLVKLLSEAGARLTVTDIDETRTQEVAEKFNCEAVAPDKIYDVKADVFAPCALGNVVNDETIPRFKFKIIAGSANNQLERTKHGILLHKKNILYAPDFLINCGGLVNVSFEYNQTSYDKEAAIEKIGDVYDTLLEVLEHADNNNLSAVQAAQEIAEQRLGILAK